jgi:hypothetical protein
MALRTLRQKGPRVSRERRTERPSIGAPRGPKNAGCPTLPVATRAGTIRRPLEGALAASVSARNIAWENRVRAALLERPQTPLVLQEVAMPEIGPREVLLRVRACGVCHTDLHLADGLFKAFGYDPFPADSRP